MKLYLITLIGIILACNQAIAENADFQNDFFKSDSQWDNAKNKQSQTPTKINNTIENSASKSGIPGPGMPMMPPAAEKKEAPATLPAPQLTSSSTPPIAAAAEPAITSPEPQIAQPAILAADAPKPVAIDEIAELPESESTLGDTPGVQLEKLIQKTPTVSEFNKTNMAKHRSVYDRRNGVPDEYIVGKEREKINSHIPKFSNQSEYSQMLFSAVVLGNISAIKTILQRNADVNSRVKETGMTPVMMAVKVKNAQVLRYLITSGADINLQNNEGQTALHISCILGLDEMFAILIKSGANISIIDKKNHHAMEYINPIFEESFIDAFLSNAKDTNTALLMLTKIKSLKGVKKAVMHGADLDTKDKDGATPLIIAAKNNDANTVGFLLYSKANHTFKDLSGSSAFDYAKRNNNIKIEDMIETVMVKSELDNTAELSNALNSKRLVWDGDSSLQSSYDSVTIKSLNEKSSQKHLKSPKDKLNLKNKSTKKILGSSKSKNNSSINNDAIVEAPLKELAKPKVKKKKKVYTKKLAEKRKIDKLKTKKTPAKATQTDKEFDQLLIDSGISKETKQIDDFIEIIDNAN